MRQAPCRKKYSFFNLVLTVHHICFGILIKAKRPVYMLTKNCCFINLKLFNWFISINVNFVMYKNAMFNLLQIRGN
jgi:hypothetical protein